MTEYGLTRYAVCHTHGGDALAHMSTVNAVEIRRVLAPDKLLNCHCGQLADFYLLELMPEEVS